MIFRQVLPVSNSRPGHLFPDLNHMMRQMESIFDAPTSRPRSGFYSRFPKTNLSESADFYGISMVVPGLKRDDLSIQWNNGKVTVSGHRKSPDPEGFKNIRRERSDYSFERSFQVGDDINPEGIHAELRDGILSLTLPKRPERQPRRIEIAG